MTNRKRVFLLAISIIMTLVGAGSLAVVWLLPLPSSPFGGAMPIGIRAYQAPEAAVHRMIADDDVYIHSLETVIHRGRTVFAVCIAVFLLFAVAVTIVTFSGRPRGKHAQQT